MPAPSPTPARPASRPVVLVVEEYAALAAAIRSALQKFAPNHQAHFAQSLPEAETLLKETSPDLFIIDFDPPHPATIAFLNHARKKHPNARMLAIAPGISREITAEVGVTGGLQMMDKPFDLAEFGAAIQALLGPWTTNGERIRGSLRDLTLVDVLHVMGVSEESLVVETALPQGRSGEVHLAGGQITHAKTADLSGLSALQAMACWRGARFKERTAAPRKNPTIQGSWKKNLLEAVQYAKAARAHDEPEKESAPRETVAPPVGKTLVVIDDTEMLLVFVEDALMTADPQLRIVTAGNATDGLREVERIQPDLVLLDYSLPDFNGDELSQKLGANKVTAGIPILMMSGHVAEMTAAAARLPNIVATIAKPFRSEQLINLVRATLAAGPLPPERKIAPPPPVAPAPVAKTAEGKVELGALRTAPPPPPSVLKLEEPKPEPRPVQRILTPLPPLRPSPSTTSPHERKMPGWRRLTTRPAPAPVPVPSPEVATVVEPEPAQRPIEIRTPFQHGGPAFAADGSEVVLGLALEVISMQLTPALRIGSIRARPAAYEVALRFSSANLPGAIPTESGFELGPVELNGNGRISIVRVIPTMRPPDLPTPRLSFEISDVSVIAANSHNRVQIMPAPAAPMTMQLLAHFQLRAVELSPTFQVAALALSGDHDAVRVTLDPKTPSREQNTTEFDISRIELDGFSRVAALQLTARP